MKWEKVTQKSAMWRHKKNEGISLSFSGVFFPTFPLIFLIFMTSHGWFFSNFFWHPLIHLQTVIVMGNVITVTYYCKWEYYKCKIFYSGVISLSFNFWISFWHANMQSKRKLYQSLLGTYRKLPKMKNLLAIEIFRPHYTTGCFKRNIFKKN